MNYVEIKQIIDMVASLMFLSVFFIVLGISCNSFNPKECSKVCGENRVISCSWAYIKCEKKK
jgi:hypothetical protein